jgi:hypothetical protein
LETLPAWTGLSYDETAGTRVVLRTDGPMSDWSSWRTDALRHYFGRDNAGLRQAVLSGSAADG